MLMSITLKLKVGKPNSAAIHHGRKKQITTLLQTDKMIATQVGLFSSVEKSVGQRNFLWPSALAFKHTAALSAFMFIQLLASGISQQNYSVCKFNLQAVTGNRRFFCRRDGGLCQSAGLYGLIGMLSKHRGMMGELWSKCPCSIPLCLFDLQLKKTSLMHLLYTLNVG